MLNVKQGSSEYLFKVFSLVRLGVEASSNQLRVKNVDNLKLSCKKDDGILQISELVYCKLCVGALMNIFNIRKILDLL